MGDPEYLPVLWTLDRKFLLQKFDPVFDNLKCAAKLNVAFGFVLKNVSDGSCRLYHAYENKTLFGRSQLVATTEDLRKIKNLRGKTDVFISCSRE